MDPRGFPTSLPEFQQAFPDDKACRAYLERQRWPRGFVCPLCDWKGDPYRFPSRSSVVLRCKSCGHNISLTAGTVMEKTHMPLCRWFWGAYLVVTQTPGMSAVQFQRQIGIKTYETAFQMLHKLRAGMIRPDRDDIGGKYPVEVDEVLIGGRTRGEGRGTHHKVLVVGAVEVRTRKEGEDRSATKHADYKDGVPLKRKHYAGRLRLEVVSSRKASSLIPFVEDNVEEDTEIRTDGWQGYDDLEDAGYDHRPVVVKGDSDRLDAHLPMIHLVFSNLKTWLRGTHHGVSGKHLQSYLNEYVYRFNRRFYPMTGFYSVLGLAAHSRAPTYKELYAKPGVRRGVKVRRGGSGGRARTR